MKKEQTVIITDLRNLIRTAGRLDIYDKNIIPIGITVDLPDTKSLECSGDNGLFLVIPFTIQPGSYNAPLHNAWYSGVGCVMCHLHGVASNWRPLAVTHKNSIQLRSNEHGALTRRYWDILIPSNNMLNGGYPKIILEEYSSQ